MCPRFIVSMWVDKSFVLKKFFFSIHKQEKKEKEKNFFVFGLKGEYQGLFIIGHFNFISYSPYINLVFAFISLFNFNLVRTKKRGGEKQLLNDNVHHRNKCQYGPLFHWCPPGRIRRVPRHRAQIQQPQSPHNEDPQLRSQVPHPARGREQQPTRVGQPRRPFRCPHHLRHHCSCRRG